MKQSAMIVAFALVVSGCSDPKAPNKSNFKQAIQAWVGNNPPCIEVPMGEVDADGVAGSAMPRFLNAAAPANSFVAKAHLERLKPFDALVAAGLLKKTTTTITEQSYFTAASKPKVAVIAYDLTDVGRAALPKPDAAPTFGGKASSLCYGKPTVDEVTQFTEPGDIMGIRASQVNYRYHLADLPDWTRDAGVRAAFPQLERDSADHLDGKAAVVLTNEGWKHEKAAKL